MNFFEFLHGYMAKLLHGFVKVVTWNCQSCSMYFFSPIAKIKVDQDFKVCWSFCFVQKVLNESKCSMTWVRCAFGNVFFLLLQSQFSIFWSGSHSTMVAAAAVLNSSPTVGRDGGNILWALCCIFGQFPSAQPSLSLANIFDCSHHCHHPKFYHPPLIRWPERDAVVGTDFEIVASATKTHSKSQYWTECRAVVQFCKHFHVKY